MLDFTVKAQLPHSQPMSFSANHPPNLSIILVSNKLRVHVVAPLCLEMNVTFASGIHAIKCKYVCVYARPYMCVYTRVCARMCGCAIFE